MVWYVTSGIPGLEIRPNPSFLHLALGRREVRGGEGSSKGKKIKREIN
jgi:hypothetical protein